VEAAAEVEVAIIITITVVMRQPSRARCTTVHQRRHLATGAVDFLMITRTDLPRTPLGHLNNISTERDTHRAALGRTHRSPRTAETLTQTVVGDTHRARCLARMAGADITLDRRAEVATVGVAAEEDIMAVAVAVAVAVVEVEVDMIMETVEEVEGSANP